MVSSAEEELDSLEDGECQSDEVEVDADTVFKIGGTESMWSINFQIKICWHNITVYLQDPLIEFLFNRPMAESG